MIELKFTHTKEEYVKAVREYLIAAKIISKVNVVFIVLFTIFSVFYAVSSGFEVISLFALTVSTMGLIIGTLVYGVMPIKIYNKSKRVQEPYDIAFDHDSIKFKTNSIDSVLQWTTYSKVWQSKNFFFLIQETNVYSVIPIRAFKNADDLHAFKALVSETIGTIRIIK